MESLIFCNPQLKTHVGSGPFVVVDSIIQGSLFFKDFPYLFKNEFFLAFERQLFERAKEPNLRLNHLEDENQKLTREVEVLRSRTPSLPQLEKENGSLAQEVTKLKKRKDLLVEDLSISKDKVNHIIVFLQV